MSVVGVAGITFSFTPNSIRVAATKRPTTLRRLTNHVASLLGKEGTGKEVSQVVEEMKRAGLIAVSGTKLEYSLK